MPMMLTLYHRTTAEAAAAILAGGFLDRAHPSEVVGVWVSSYPVDLGDGAKGNHLLEIRTDCTADDLIEYDLTDDTRGITEWCIPAEVLNAFTRRIVPPEEEAGIEPPRAMHHIPSVFARHMVWQIAPDRPRAGRWRWMPLDSDDPAAVDSDDDPPWFEDYETMEGADAAARAYFDSLDGRTPGG